jgi:hypothetical protein
LIGLALGATVDRRFFLVPGLVAGFLLQHAVQGWCPPIPFFRRRGFRTASEIDRSAMRSRHCGVISGTSRPARRMTRTPRSGRRSRRCRHETQ